MKELQKKLVELIKKLGVNLEGKEKELEEGLESIIPTEPEKEKTKGTESETITALNSQVDSLKGIIAELQKDRNASIEAEKEKLEREKATKISTLKQKGIEAGKLTEGTWDKKWKTIAEKDPENFENILEDLAVDPHFKKDSEEKEEKPKGIPGPFDSADPGILKAMSEMSNSI